MYRPEGWENPYCENCLRTYIADGNTCRGSECLFEIGADAMLEALIEKGTPCVLDSMDNVFGAIVDLQMLNLIGNKTGKLVFIPDKEE